MLRNTGYFDQCLEHFAMVLVEGGVFLLFETGKTTKEVRLWLDEDQKNINSDNGNSINLLDIVQIQYGCETDLFFNMIQLDENQLVDRIYDQIVRILSWMSGETLRGSRLHHRILPPNYFSIVFVENNSRKTLHLKSKDPSTALQWCRELKVVIDDIIHLRQIEDHHNWVMRQFQEADTSQSGSLDWQETYRLLTNLSLYKTQEEIEVLCHLANINSNQQHVIDFDHFSQLYELIAERPEISEIFEKYVNDDGVIDARALNTFFIEEQGDSGIDVTNVIQCYEESEILKEGKISLKGFTRLLKSSSLFNCLTSSSKANDMDQPLCDYYICTSHNTVMEEGKLFSRTTIEDYTSALEKGCRCMELVLWDGPNGEPVIHHGRTFTVDIEIHHVLRYGILPNAFKCSPYPLILSVEQHLSLEQQDVLADCLKSVFGEMLYISDVDTLTQLPSPDQLRGKVIVMTDTTQRLSRKFRSVINICQSIWFENSSQKDEFYHVSSLSEIKAKHQIETTGNDMIRHADQRLMRVYPAGIRVQSANYDPVTYWNSGFQMVALNFQSTDDHLMINWGRFRSTGGYVLKPKSGIMKSIEDLTASPVRMSIQLRVISGQNLSSETGDEPISPCVDIQIRGHVADDTKIHKTRIVADNGWNPFWSSLFHFDIKVPELAIIVFTVNDKNRSVASLAMPVLNLPQGYRHVPLTNMFGVPLPKSSIFIHSKINIY